ncbi:MAG: bifunctional diguanylate cyclase/phosphodiesterase [Pseudomonadota bacterium]
MASAFRNRLIQALKETAEVLSGPQILAFLPALTLAAFWLGGEIALLMTAALVPLTWLLFAGLVNDRAPRGRDKAAAKTRVLDKIEFTNHVDDIRHECTDKQSTSALFAIELDDYDVFVERYGHEAAERLSAETKARLTTSLRETDMICHSGDHRFTIVLGPAARIDLEAAIQVAGRFMKSIEEPHALDGTTVFTTACVGFCLLRRAPGSAGQEWIEACNTALLEAKRRGPCSIRAYSEELQKITTARAGMRDEVREALESGQIQPWFQPQISTDTGQVTGFEALARWNHPERGMISPAEFLPAIEETGLLERLAEVMVFHSFTALKAWDAAGMHVPRVGVNFSGSELSNPALPEKIQWELDRFDLAPDRLAVEILETVVAQTPDDTITRNIKALTALGCRIDLDDFGTGNASIASVRRFEVGRIKIDRSFVMKADRDPEQQRMISAILSMAERLGLETLAEGVETAGEHALLSQLGCDHVQGFSIGRPMPFDQTLDWISAHEAKVEEPPVIPKRKA